ncbi:DNA repair protein RadA [Patescibacteria group bacterium]|nr:DNA repair protein RadA [Patescibacteria group bacterium]
MPKNTAVFVCQSCGASTQRWEGKCPTCGEWNTLVEEIQRESKSSTRLCQGYGGQAKPVNLNQVKSFTNSRISSGIGEMDRVLGGGFVPGQVVLLAGEPGIGKSTLLLQIASKLEKQRGRTPITASVLYVAGEESPEQIKLRAERLGINQTSISILPITDVDEIISNFNSSTGGQILNLIIIDSIQTLTTSDLTGTAGSIGQVRECATRISEYAKINHIPVILVGHITKDGTIAGPKVLEHLVDTVLYMEGESNHLFRLLRTTKNRFGAVSEVGVFSMNDKGLVEVPNPSDLFLEERLKNVPGSVVTIVMEGTRPVALEIQALTSKTPFGFPKRTASGFSLNRLNLLCAVLTKRAGINLWDQDVFINVAGGVTIAEPAGDLAVCLAIASSVKNKPINAKTVAFGEVGLSGEVRRVARMGERSKEARKLGFGNIVSGENFKSLSQSINIVLG